MDEPFVPLVVIGRRFINLYIQKIELEYGDPYDWLRAVGVPIGPLFLSDEEIALLLGWSVYGYETNTYERLLQQASKVFFWSSFQTPQRLVYEWRNRFAGDPVDHLPELITYHVIGIQGAYERL